MPVGRDAEEKLYLWPIWPVNVVDVAVVSVKTGWNAPPLSDTKILYVAMPGPAASLPDHDKLMVSPAVRGRHAVTELVGGRVSIVLTILSVLIGAFVSKTTVACADRQVARGRGQRGNGVADKTLALGRSDVGGQEAGPRIGGEVEGLGVERGERPGYEARLQIDSRRDVDQDAERGGQVEFGAIRVEALGNLDDRRAEADLAQLEGGPVEVGACTVTVTVCAGALALASLVNSIR